MAPNVTIPKQGSFKPAEVCGIAGVQPYILRSWEAEFPMLGRGKGNGGARLYRRADVEMVLQIKDLVFGEGLTLGAARRKIEAEATPTTTDDADADDAVVGDLFAEEARQRLSEVKDGLRSILRMLTGAEGGAAGQRAPTDRQTASPRELAPKATKRSASSDKKPRRAPKRKSA